MTESTGGSDVGASLTRAVQEQGVWRLYGKKWFTSAITADMALTLARPEGNGPGGGGLAMFYVETHDSSGAANGIRVERLKDKLGTRKVPTAELTLEGARAELVSEARNGTRHIEPMLVVTRTWNSVTSVAFMRRGLMLARSYAEQRRAFGAQLDQLPLHVDTLAGLEAETRGAFLLAFELVELMGRLEAGEIDDQQRALLRLITPIAKLLTAKQAVSVVSECIEAFGGAGYVEDTGLPTLLRDTQVLPIWEGTTNVLSLDAVLRGELARGLPALRARVEQCVGQRSRPAPESGRRESARGRRSRRTIAASAGRRNADPVKCATPGDDAGTCAGTGSPGRARSMGAGRVAPQSGVAAGVRFAASPIDLLAEVDPEDSAQLLRE